MDGIRGWCRGGSTWSLSYIPLLPCPSCLWANLRVRMSWREGGREAKHASERKVEEGNCKESVHVNVCRTLITVDLMSANSLTLQ